ncbi:phosphoglycerate dehydrogenase [Alloscardovia macacae]|uniref:D-3-phosphoglycerate dehydrogenase n=1 Tax=Alloscardovia macacae TaxID=1160091 RepID=A0A261F5S0_9BIFI|nr:phosphoglycerate dehydrogenase [Alloscardovia macacae]OZG54415.1 D-3-phosphoglycerate dehydrogenase [Alloscardovia macacae]
MTTALLLENIHATAADFLRSRGIDVMTAAGAMDEDELISAVTEHDVNLLGIRSKTQVTARVLEACPSLEAVGCFSIGTNQVDLGSAAQKGVAVFNAPYSNTRSVMELVISDIIALMRRVPEHTLSIRSHTWDKTAKKSHEVRGKTLGIVGYGNIGSQVSILAEALGMNVVFYDIEEKLALGNATRMNSMEELLRISDAVTLHIDGRASNAGIFGERYFSMMKQDAVFMNLSRGFIIDVQALYNHLKSGHLSGAAVDVFPTEPKATGDEFDTPLTEIANVILTPHVGGSTLEAQKAIGEFVSHKLYDYLVDGNTSLSVNMPNLNVSAVAGSGAGAGAGSAGAGGAVGAGAIGSGAIGATAHARLARIAHLHTNLPGILAKLNNVLSAKNLNIVAQSLATEGDLGYVITDVAGVLSEEDVQAVQDIPGTVRVHIL